MEKRCTWGRVKQCLSSNYEQFENHNNIKDNLKEISLDAMPDRIDSDVIKLYKYREHVMYRAQKLDPKLWLTPHEREFLKQFHIKKACRINMNKNNIMCDMQRLLIPSLEKDNTNHNHQKSRIEKICRSCIKDHGNFEFALERLRKKCKRQNRSSQVNVQNLAITNKWSLSTKIHSNIMRRISSSKNKYNVNSVKNVEMGIFQSNLSYIKLISSEDIPYGEWCTFRLFDLNFLLTYTNISEIIAERIRNNFSKILCCHKILGYLLNEISSDSTKIVQFMNKLKLNEKYFKTFDNCVKRKQIAKIQNVVQNTIIEKTHLSFEDFQKYTNVYHLIKSDLLRKYKEDYLKRLPRMGTYVRWYYRDIFLKGDTWPKKLEYRKNIKSILNFQLKTEHNCNKNVSENNPVLPPFINYISETNLKDDCTLNLRSDWATSKWNNKSDTISSKTADNDHVLEFRIASNIEVAKQNNVINVSQILTHSLSFQQFRSLTNADEYILNDIQKKSPLSYKEYSAKMEKLIKRFYRKEFLKMNSWPKGLCIKHFCENRNTDNYSKVQNESNLRLREVIIPHEVNAENNVGSDKKDFVNTGCYLKTKDIHLNENNMTRLQCNSNRIKQELEISNNEDKVEIISDKSHEVIIIEDNHPTTENLLREMMDIGNNEKKEKSTKLTRNDHGSLQAKAIESSRTDNYVNKSSGHINEDKNSETYFDSFIEDVIPLPLHLNKVNKPIRD